MAFEETVPVCDSRACKKKKITKKRKIKRLIEVVFWGRGSGVLGMFEFSFSA